MPNAPRTIGSLRPKQKRIDMREPAHKRGYDHDWAALRAWHIRQHPLCEDCLDEGVTNATHIEVDHVKPFNGKDDPLRLDASNLRSRCRRHHRIKTLRDIQ